MTCFALIEGHSNLENTKIVVHPDMRERLFTAGDIPQSFSKTYLEFEDQLSKMDVSLMKDKDGQFREFYFLDNLETEHDFAYKEADEDLDDQKITEATIDILRKTFPRPFESFKSGVQRSEKVTDFIKSKYSECEGNILMVGHSFMWRVTFGEWENVEEKYDKLPEKSYIMKNCELLSDSKNFPKK